MGYKIGGLEDILQSSENQRTNKRWTLVHIKSGAGIVMLDGRLKGLSDGDMIFIPPYSSYSFRSEELGDEYNVNLDAVFLQFDQAWLNDLQKVFRGVSSMVLAVKGIKSAMYVTGAKWLKLSGMLDSFSGALPHIQSVLLLNILEQLSLEGDYVAISREIVPMPSTRERLNRIESFIDSNFIEGVVLDDIAAYAGINRTYFCLFFKRHFGVSLTDYVNSKRIALAESLLHRSDLSIADVSRQSGFSNVPYFNRVFKSLKGQSPKHFRSSLRQLSADVPAGPDVTGARR